MVSYKIGDVFEEMTTELANWCNNNNAYVFADKSGESPKYIIKKSFENIPTEEELLQQLREQREIECFSIINRGQLWYNSLTEEQLAELQVWYKAWLDVTETKVVPEKLEWLK